MAKWGMLGGSFDPIHLGHLALAEAARETFHLQGVLFVPAAQPPHKPGWVLAAAADRLAMVRLATADNPYFRVSPMELGRTGPSYTIDTVRQLREEEPDTDWHLILGSDVLVEMSTWHRFRELLTMVNVLAAARPGTAPILPPDLTPWSARIAIFHPPALDISATLIRERVKQGLSLRYLVPAEAAEYLAAHGLYRPTV